MGLFPKWLTGFFIYILILIFIYFFKYETIVRSSAWSFGHLDFDPSTVVFVTFGCPSFPAFKRNDILGSQQRLKIAKIISIYGWPLCRKEGATKRDRDHHLDFLATYSGPAEGHKWFFGGTIINRRTSFEEQGFAFIKAKIWVGQWSPWPHFRRPFQ